jgi:hypothetical protein
MSTIGKYIKQKSPAGKAVYNALRGKMIWKPVMNTGKEIYKDATSIAEKIPEKIGTVYKSGINRITKGIAKTRKIQGIGLYKIDQKHDGSLDIELIASSKNRSGGGGKKRKTRKI